MLLVKQKPGQAADYLAKTINRHLADGQKVLWFLSGGSSIELAVRARRQIKNNKGLIVMLIDERYGPDNHPDSNWRQLKDGNFDFSGIEAVPVLEGLSAEETAERFREKLNRYLAEADFRIGLMGIGADGHTSGILPGSPALDSNELAIYYQGPDYERITTTPVALAQLDEVVVSLSDEKKRPIVEKLQQNIGPADMPAQLLKKVPRFIIFNDWIGEDKV